MVLYIIVNIFLIFNQFNGPGVCFPKASLAPLNSIGVTELATIVAFGKRTPRLEEHLILFQLT